MAPSPHDQPEAAPPVMAGLPPGGSTHNAPFALRDERGLLATVGSLDNALARALGAPITRSEGI